MTDITKCDICGAHTGYRKRHEICPVGWQYAETKTEDEYILAVCPEHNRPEEAFTPISACEYCGETATHVFVSCDDDEDTPRVVFACAGCRVTAWRPGPGKLT